MFGNNIDYIGRILNASDRIVWYSVYQKERPPSYKTAADGHLPGLELGDADGRHCGTYGSDWGAAFMSFADAVAICTTHLDFQNSETYP